MFRRATHDDLLALTELERDANVVGLTHVFPPDRFPFPFDAVLARWRLVLDDPTTVVLVQGSAEGLLALAAHDDTTLRHLAVHPNHWGQGLASTAIGLVLDGLESRGCREAGLWALRENHRARSVYQHLGWRETPEVREAPWPPHPEETRWTLSLG